MLPLVKTPIQKLEKYQDIISDSLFEEINYLAKDLKGLKVVHINSTPRGGGVAEMLKSLVPLMKGVGIKAQWHTIPARQGIFEITKKIHNALQGKDYEFSVPDQKKYLSYLKEITFLMKDTEADIWVIHDPQPAGIISYFPDFHPSICCLHIDLTSPDKKVWDFIAGFLKEYNKVILSLEQYIKPEIREKSVVFPPGIDPLQLKNQPLNLKEAKEILESFGISSQKPLISQVSRFDIFKDPLGVIKAYKVAKKEVPLLQLVLVGFFLASDDPQAINVYEKCKKESENDPNIFLFSDANLLSGLKVDTFVNAIQTGSDVILQKSVKEGFGLTVTEAMWKEKPVIGGNVGGIKLQIKDGQNGFLVDTPQQAGKRIIQLIKNPDLAKKISKEAHQTVKENFLIPRVLRDYLKLFKELV